MFVTCYYDIYNNPDNLVKYLHLFTQLATSELPIIIFTEPGIIHNFSFISPNVKVIGVPLNTFELYNISMNYSGELPKDHRLPIERKAEA